MHGRLRAEYEEPPFEPRRISTRLTDLQVWMARSWLLVGFPYFVATVFAGSGFGSSETLWLQLAFVVGTIPVMVVPFWQVAHARRVVLDEAEFLISNGDDPVVVPYDAVVAVGVSRLTRPKRLWLDLMNHPELGERVYFMPTWRFFGLFPHPVIRELRRRLARHAGVDESAYS